MEWATADPAGYWAPGEIDWDSPQLFALPRIVNDRLHGSQLQIRRARASFHLPDGSQNAAHEARKDEVAKEKEKATGRGNSEETDEAQGEQQLPIIVDWPGSQEPLPLEEEQKAA